MLLLISGSPHPQSANSKFLAGIGKLQRRQVQTADYLADLPVFQPAIDKAPWPDIVLKWRSDLAKAEAVVFSTPAYLHNLPGVLKNALDWLASSGELEAIAALVFTFAIMVIGCAECACHNGRSFLSIQHLLRRGWRDHPGR
jgi:chromate reductase